jgi:CRP-like cAMP-binding protein
LLNRAESANDSASDKPLLQAAVKHAIKIRSVMKEFTTFIKSHVELNETELEIILSNFKEKKIKKDRYILKEGKIAADYFYIVAGGFRIYYQHNNKQMTAWVALEGVFFTDLASMKNQIPSQFNFQAIEDSTILTIKKEKMDRLYTKFSHWQEFGRKVWEDAFLNVVEGAMRFQSMTAEERYLSEMKQSEFLQRIPLKELASFLGITPTSLSRLRKKIR